MDQFREVKDESRTATGSPRRVATLNGRLYDLRNTKMDEGICRQRAQGWLDGTEQRKMILL